MATIPTNLKYFLIIVSTFGVVYWFQAVDDKKRCKERNNIYEKIKLPLLVSAIVGLVLLWNNDSLLTIFVSSTCVEEINPNIDMDIKPQPQPEFISKQQLPSINMGKPDFDVYTGLPEW